MNSIRKAIRKYRKPMRLAVLLLVFSALIPIDQVWCKDSEDGVPRLEPAINGTCISLASANCCPDKHQPRKTTRQARQLLSQTSIAGNHDPCCGCSDTEANLSQQATHRLLAVSPPTAHFGGCLYQLSSCTVMLDLISPGRPLHTGERVKPPDLALLQTISIILLN
jgi:hypothetical protein